MHRKHWLHKTSRGELFAVSDRQLFAVLRSCLDRPAQKARFGTCSWAGGASFCSHTLSRHQRSWRFGFKPPTGNKSGLSFSLTYLLTPCSTVLLEKLIGLQLVNKFPAFYGTRSSLPHSQVPATCPYPKPARSSPYPHNPLPEDPS